MKHSLLALALLATVSGAAAQSSLTLFGIVDGGLRYIRPGVDGVDSTFGVGGGQSAGNRFGLRGSESLGGDLRAVFQIETGFDFNTGKLGQTSASADKGRLFGREASVGLESRWGALRVGRFGTLGSGTGTSSLINDIDPFGTGFSDAGVQATQAFTFLVLDNAVAYKSPLFKGWQFGLMGSFATDGGEQPGGRDANLTYQGAALTFAQGPLWSGVSYEKLDWSAFSGGERPDENAIKFNLNYDFGPIKPYFSYARTDNFAQLGGESAGAGYGDSALYFHQPTLSSDAFMLGLTAPLAGGKLLASYQYLSLKDKQGGALDDNQRQILALGYDHPLSLRTSLYGAYSYSKGDGALFGKSGPLAVAATTNRSVTHFGLRHAF